MKKILLTTLALSLLAAPLASANTNINFSDLDEDHPRFNQIQWLARSGVVEGYPDGTFRPENCVNRAEFLKILYTTTYADTEVAAQTSNPFPDVDENAWYGGYVLAAYADGVISGYGDGTFKPDQCVTKPEVLKMASEAYYSDEIINRDHSYNGEMPNGVTKDAWFYKYYSFAHPMNLAVYDPEFTKDYPISFQGATRADVAETLWRFQSLRDSDAEYYEENQTQPKEIFMEYQGIDEMLTFYYPSEWDITEDYFYETAGGETSEKATIILEDRVSEEIISINLRQVQCIDQFGATCLETDIGYSISSVAPSRATLKAMQKIQSTLTYDSPEFNSQASMPTNYLTINTEVGSMKFELYGNATPELTKNIIELSNQNKYEDVIFHRVIKDFMIQSGDFENNDGTGGHSYLGEGTGLTDEYHPDLTHTYGSLAMAKSSLPNSIGSQFYIVNNKEGTLFLDKRYSVIGQLIEGFDTLEKISNQDVTEDMRGEISKPVNPIKIISTEAQEI